MSAERWRALLASLILSIGAAVLFWGRAEAADPFYKGKTLTILVGVGPGGSFDLYARLAARHLSDFIPGHPNIVVQNMPGAGGLTAVNYLAGVAPRDGTELEIMPPAIGLVQLLGRSGVHYDARKFAWIGRLTSITQVFYTWRTSPTKSLSDLLTRETTLGGTGPSADSTVFAKLMNDLLGTKFEVVQGYNDTGSVMLAMQRGEVEGIVRPWEGMKSGQERNWMADGQINLIAQYSLERHRELPQVPAIYELAKTDSQKRMLRLFLTLETIGRSFAFGPETPEDRVVIVRTAFQTMLKDRRLSPTRRS
jgi:tripartite-type tricarboxylate transporter receptor subunit TctC